MPETLTLTFLPLGDQMVVGVIETVSVGAVVSAGGGATRWSTLATFESGLMSAVVVPSVQMPVSIR